MRTIAALAVLGMMTLAALPPTAATHGDTAYLVGVAFPFVAEGYYSHGPGYLDQYWNFNVVSVMTHDRCNDIHGGWDPHPVNGGTPGFSGVCDSGAALSTTGLDHYHPYPYSGGYDTHTIQVTYAGSTFDAQLVTCDSAHPRLRALLGSTYCNDVLLGTQL